MGNGAGLALLALLAACGGGSGDNGLADTSPVAQTVAVELLTSSPDLPSAGTEAVTLSVRVKGLGSAPLVGQLVGFSATSGLLSAGTATTDATGAAQVTLSPGADRTNRVITVKASAGVASATVSVRVTGTTLTVAGSSTAQINQSVPLSVQLRDSAGAPIAGQAVTLSSALGNLINPASMLTDSGGNAAFTYTAVTVGQDTLTATAGGSSTARTLIASDRNLVITSPAAGTEIVISDPNDPIAPGTQLLAHFDIAGVNQANTPVRFSTTRGSITQGPPPDPSVPPALSLSANTSTDADGNTLPVVLRSPNAGPALITATAGDTSVQIEVEFVSDQPFSLDLQALPAVLGPSEEATLAAVVRDARDNPVKNQTVLFNIETDVSGGRLLSPSAVTDSQGRATVTYRAGLVTTPQGGVRLRAEVQSNPAINDTSSLTVAKKALFIKAGTGGALVSPTSTTYRLDYTVFVTDSNGNPVGGAEVTVGVLPLTYLKGFYEIAGTGEDKSWSLVDTVTCPAEDGDFDGLLDPGEDANGNGRLEPGGVASAQPASVTTDGQGMATIGVAYPQEFGNWVDVQLSFRAESAGSEDTDVKTFRLPILFSEITDTDSAPPGQPSPFGTDPSCASPD